ncbi:hypothetical protein CO038_02185 [Candidatus Pacearchaeota archaeon CG_4_9_14_0_2_um_filter_39_13]|nr:hypothetical protein [Candidatus Pacearchaeota archaeon]OIO43905.1 MAG: hypothetical protein AUJ64_01240 [Candidatus Pacearchaeota archaeon CG1_02_39_14]PJC44754.1 MAG: hypothetical protein CO038_02185 [Candidatus Pacearchaeota archaeon CG_4_9_14_0_2_um_filter_39_13]
MLPCKICGQENCKKHSFLLPSTKRTEFSGSSPPEIFVGKWNYPDVYTGILAPETYGNNEIMSSPELWHSKKLQIPDIMSLRNQLIYTRKQNNIKKLNTKFHQTFNEIAMTHKSVATEFRLKKPSSLTSHPDSRVPLISRAAPLDSVKIQENTKIKKKIDYLVNDTDIKSAPAILELHKSGIQISNIIKILSAGLLGLKKNRRLVPTRWSITATDDTISKNKLEKIRYFPEISEFQVFNAEYLGNHYEFLLLPDKYSFEVMEISMKNFSVWNDYETFFPRKKYADSVTGAYYANRLALVEYLEKIKRQASCIVMREIRPEYYAPCGVGILREASRAAFQQKVKTFPTLKLALEDIQARLRLNVKNFTQSSWLLDNYGKQTKLSRFF